MSPFAASKVVFSVVMSYLESQVTSLEKQVFPPQTEDLNKEKVSTHMHEIDRMYCFHSDNFLIFPYI